MIVKLVCCSVLLSCTSSWTMGINEIFGARISDVQVAAQSQRYRVLVEIQCMSDAHRSVPSLKQLTINSSSSCIV